METTDEIWYEYWNLFHKCVDEMHSVVLDELAEVTGQDRRESVTVEAWSNRMESVFLPLEVEMTDEQYEEWDEAVYTSDALSFARHYAQTHSDRRGRYTFRDSSSA